MFCAKGQRDLEMGLAQCSQCGLLFSDPGAGCPEIAVNAETGCQPRAAPMLTISRYRPLLQVGYRNDFEVSVPADIVEDVEAVEIRMTLEKLAPGRASTEDHRTRRLHLENGCFANDLPFCPIEPGNVAAAIVVNCRTHDEVHSFRARPRFFAFDREVDPAYLREMLRGKKFKASSEDSVLHRIINDADIEEIELELRNSVAANIGNHSGKTESKTIGRHALEIGWEEHLQPIGVTPLPPAESHKPHPTNTCHLSWRAGASCATTRVYNKSRLAMGRAGSGNTEAWLGLFDEHNALDKENSEFVSNHHLSIRFDAGYQVRDEGSRNGSYLNNAPLACEWVPLADGAKIRPGRKHLSLELVAHINDGGTLVLERRNNHPGLENWAMLPQGAPVDLAYLARPGGHQPIGAILVHDDGGFQLVTEKEGIIVGNKTLAIGQKHPLQPGDQIVAGALVAVFGVGSGYPGH